MNTDGSKKNRPNRAEINRNHVWYVMGFRSKLLGTDADPNRQNEMANKVFVAGQKVAKSVRLRLSDTLDAVLADAVRLQKRAHQTHEIVTAQLLRIGRSPPSLEPCATCWLISVCKELDITCQVFRAYAGGRRGRGRVPDKLWADSWPPDKDEKMNGTKKAKPGRKRRIG